MRSKSESRDQSRLPVDSSLYTPRFGVDRLGFPTPDLLSTVPETFYRRSPDARANGAFLFLDEVQAVPEWARFARRVLDTERVRLHITGSSAKMLSTDVATEFRGRGLAVDVWPFSSAEYARHMGEPAVSLRDDPERAAVGTDEHPRDGAWDKAVVRAILIQVFP